MSASWKTANERGMLLALLGHVAMRRMREAHGAHDLSPRQFHPLGLLHDHGAMAQTELGQRTAIDPSIIVTMLNPLEANGFSTRERDPEGRRRHRVNLTPVGATHLPRAADAPRETEDALHTGLDETQREQLRLLLMRVEAGLEHETLCTTSVTSEDGGATEGSAGGY
jgi:DNA-binding MarR family transcriptional regulator